MWGKESIAREGERLRHVDLELINIKDQRPIFLAILLFDTIRQ